MQHQASTHDEHAESNEKSESPAERSLQGDQVAGETRLLVVLDDSPASDRVLEYVAGVIGGGGRFHIVLLELLRHFPPELLEHGGAEDPATEKSLDAELRDQQKEWMLAAQHSAQEDLHRAVTSLRKAGVREGVVETLCCQPEEGADTVEFILGIAREGGCQTIVVARPGSGSHESFSQKVGKDLLRRRSGLSVWAVA